MSEAVLRPFPEDFPHKGEYIVWDKSWSRVGFSNVPQYAGQMPICFPEDATPLECFLGGYIGEHRKAEHD